MAVGNNIGKLYTWTDTSGKKYTVNPASSGGWMDSYQTYATDRKTQLDTAQGNLKDTLSQNNATTNANYDQSARQAYVDYMRKQRALPSQLQALGVNGGATESGLLNLYNNYGSAHAANEQQRMADLNANKISYDEAYNTAYQNYLSDLNEQKQQAISNQINEYNNEVMRFSSTVAQYPTTKKGYENYQKWIENLDSSKDPLKDIKVALVRQQMAKQFPDGKPSSGGSSGGKSSRRSGGYSRSYSSGGSNNNNSAPKDTTVSDAMDAYRKANYKSRSNKSTKKSSSTKKVWANNWSR